MGIRRIWPTGWRAIVLLIVGSVMGANLIAPAVAHISTVTHTWTKHFQPLADKRYVRLGVNSYLPKGKTQTGTVMSRVDTAGYAIDDASFLMPLNFTPTVVLVDNDGTTPLPTGCPGSVNSPRANPGYLCVYAGFMSEGNSWDGHWDVADGYSCGSGPGLGLCRRGIVIYKYNADGSLEAAGAWAVTAPTATAAAQGSSTPSKMAKGTGAQG